MLDENVMEPLVVVGRHAEYRVFEEREGDHVGGPEIAEEIVAPVQQVLEERDRSAHPGRELGNAPGVGPWLLSSAAIRFGGRFQTLLNQSTKTRTSARRAGSRGKSGGSGTRCSSQSMIAGESLTISVSVDQYRDKPLAAHSLDGRTVARVDVDPLDLDRLVPGGQCDPLDIGRERDSVDANQIQFFRLKNQIWPTVVAAMTPHENA